MQPVRTCCNHSAYTQTSTTISDETTTMAASSPPAQTTLIIGGSNGTATLCAILGDKSKPVNENHTLRVATRSSRKYVDGGRPRVWRCTEKKHLSDIVSADFLPTRILTHVGVNPVDI